MRELTTQPIPQSVSYEQLTIPASWVTGSVISLLSIFGSLVWWVSNIKNKVENNKASLLKLEEKIKAKEDHEAQNKLIFKEEILSTIKGDMAQSASNICHGFELFAQEQRQTISTLQKGLDARNVTVNRMFNKIDDLEKKQYQRGNIATSPSNYD